MTLVGTTGFEIPSSVSLNPPLELNNTTVFVTHLGEIAQAYKPK